MDDWVLISTLRIKVHTSVDNFGRSNFNFSQCSFNSIGCSKLRSRFCQTSIEWTFFSQSFIEPETTKIFDRGLVALQLTLSSKSIADLNFSRCFAQLRLIELFLVDRTFSIGTYNLWLRFFNFGRPNLWQLQESECILQNKNCYLPKMS